MTNSSKNLLVIMTKKKTDLAKKEAAMKNIEKKTQMRIQVANEQYSQTIEAQTEDTR